MKLGALAGATGIGAKTIRYYESIGLLPDPPRRPSGYRDYSSGDVARLEFVAQGKALGLSLEEIGDILRASSDDAVNCDHVLALLPRKRDEIDGWFDDAVRMRDALSRTIDASIAQLGRSQTAYHCPVIERGLHERALGLDQQLEQKASDDHD